MEKATLATFIEIKDAKNYLNNIKEIQIKENYAPIKTDIM